MMLCSPRYNMYMQKFLTLKLFLLQPDLFSRENQKNSHPITTKKQTQKKILKPTNELLKRGTQPLVSSTGCITICRFTSLFHLVKEVEGHTSTVLVLSQSALTCVHSSADISQFYFKASTSAILECWHVWPEPPMRLNSVCNTSSSSRKISRNMHSFRSSCRFLLFSKSC